MGGDYTDAWTAGSNAKGAGPGRGTGPEGCRAARLGRPGSRPWQSRQKAKCVMRKWGKEREASCPKKRLRPNRKREGGSESGLVLRGAEAVRRHPLGKQADGSLQPG